jgi:hypothetical protein
MKDVEAAHDVHRCLVIELGQVLERPSAAQVVVGHHVRQRHGPTIKPLWRAAFPSYLPDMTRQVLPAEAASFAATYDFFDRFQRGTARQRSKLVTRAPLPDIQLAATRHPDPFTRRWCLFFLDHYATDESMPVFAEALRDPVDFVRNMALHSLACEACKSEDLCVADVVPGLIEVLQTDPSPDLRMKAIPLLLKLSAADERARAAVERAARTDADQFVRQAATDALAGRITLPRKRYQRAQRRHAKLHGTR